jgi:serine protease inhibitor
MHRRRRLLPLLAAPLLAAAAPSAVIASSPLDVATADNAFGLHLLSAVQKTVPKSNVVLSPVSAALNLSMVLNGADGETKQEMLAALSLAGSDLAAINTANAELIKMIRTPATSVTLSVADSLWVDSRRATLRPDYMKRMHASYDAELADLDFSSPNAAGRINDWAFKETQGKIPKVIERIDPSELLFLVNAVYFKGEWTHKFDKAKTQQRDFTLEGGKTKQVARMAQAGRFEYFETPQMQGIRLPFGDGALVMEILLPASSSSLGALEKELTPGNWKDWRARFMQRPGTIELPRFELKSRYKLNAPLQALGMRRAFEPGAAELTGLLSSASSQPHSGQFSISSVLQSTYWKMDEAGSEAAAATTTGVRSTAIARPEEPFRMIVDRPFFCAIQDERSGALLFVGAIYDPEG